MRKLCLKIHQWLALPVGIILSVVCLTGAIMVFENEILQGLNPEVEISAIGKHDPARRELKGATFFRQTMRLHRWLLDPPAKKGEGSTGKWIVGTATLLMVVILASGLVAWWPRNRKALRNRLTVTCTKGWPRLWHDYHTSLGFYALLLLLLMALTGLTWSFGWFRDAAYSLLDFIPDNGQRRFLYSLHTGSWGGMVTRILYFLAALIGAFLPWTGYYLWWKKRKRSRQTA